MFQSNFTYYPNKVSFLFGLGSHFALNNCVSLVSFNLEQMLSLSLCSQCYSWKEHRLFILQARAQPGFVDVASGRDSDMCSWEKYTEVMPSSPHCIASGGSGRWPVILLVIAISISRSVWYVQVSPC